MLQNPVLFTCFWGEKKIFHLPSPWTTGRPEPRKYPETVLCLSGCAPAALSHLNKAPKPQKSPRLTKETAKLLLKKPLQCKVLVWRVQIFAGKSLNCRINPGGRTCGGRLIQPSAQSRLQGHVHVSFDCMQGWRLCSQSWCLSTLLCGSFFLNFVCVAVPLLLLDLITTYFSEKSLYSPSSQQVAVNSSKASTESPSCCNAVSASCTPQGQCLSSLCPALCQEWTEEKISTGLNSPTDQVQIHSLNSLTELCLAVWIGHRKAP